MRHDLRKLVPPIYLSFRPDDPVESVHATLVKNRRDAGIVLDQAGCFLGIVTKDDFYAAFGQKNLLVKDIMQSDWARVRVDLLVEEVIRLPQSWIVISEGEAILGVINKATLLEFALSNIEANGEFLSALFEAAHSGIVAVNQHGLITHMNRSAEEIRGVSREYAVGSIVTEVFPETTLMRVIETGIPEYGVKTNITGKTIVTNRSPIYRDGKIIGGVAIFQSLSELDSLHSELNTVKQLYRELETILDVTYDGIVVTDGHGVILRVNSALEKLLERDASQLVGRRVEDLLNTGLFDVSATLRTLQEKRTVSLAQTLVNNRQTVSTSVPVFDEKGDIVRVVTNIRDMTELSRVQEEVERIKAISKKYEMELAQLRNIQRNDDVVIVSPEMKKQIHLAAMVAKSEATVLITGESGVGKEVVAKLIHQNSLRKEGPFVAINCGAIPELLLESELFGYEKGAFTGANAGGKIGLFELANGGTLLLDEVCELPLNLQVKLLRALQERQIYRVGGNQPIKLNVRIIATSNRDLFALVRDKKFRADLYYRINVIPIRIPALRERKEDIVPLAMFFLKKYNQQYGLRKRFSSELLQWFVNYRWPGNVRELQNFVERLVLTNEDDVLGLETREVSANLGDMPIRVCALIPWRQGLELVEKQLLSMALAKGKSIRAAARLLGLDHSTVVKKIKSYRLTEGK